MRKQHPLSKLTMQMRKDMFQHYYGIIQQVSAIIYQILEESQNRIPVYSGNMSNSWFVYNTHSGAFGIENGKFFSPMAGMAFDPSAIMSAGGSSVQVSSEDFTIHVSKGGLRKQVGRPKVARLRGEHNIYKTWLAGRATDFFHYTGMCGYTAYYTNIVSEEPQEMRSSGFSDFFDSAVNANRTRIDAIFRRSG